jgi:hypothetical protein
MVLSVCAFALDSDQELAMGVAKRYCAACHAIEPMRFIVSESPETNWQFIHENGPRPGVTWAQRMIDLLSWPVSDPKSLKDPGSPNARWMPVGQKRYSISQEQIDQLSAREFLLDVLRN